MFSLVSKLGTLLLAGHIAWLGWSNLGPRKPEIGPIRQELANQAVSEITESLRLNRGDARDVILLHFANDSTDYFTSALRSVIEQRGVLELRDRNFTDKLRDRLNLRQPFCKSIDEAALASRSANAQAALFGALRSFESYPEGARIDVEYKLVAYDGKVVFGGHYQKEMSNASLVPEIVQETVGAVPWFSRGLAWLLAVLLLPVFTINFVRTMVRKRSNRANAFVLAIYTLVDAILAYMLVGAALSGFWPVLFFLLAVVAAFAYNVRIMTFALRLEEA